MRLYLASYVGLNTHPNLPSMVETESLRPDADHPPAVKQDDSHCDSVEHGLRAEVVAPLDEPKGVNAKCLERSDCWRGRVLGNR